LPSGRWSSDNDDSIPGLQDRNVEDISDDDDDDDDDEESVAVQYWSFGKNRKDYDDDDNSDSDNESYGATVCRQQEDMDDNALAIPELIRRNDNDDSSDDDDNNSVGCLLNDYTSSNIKNKSPRMRLKNRYLTTKTFKTNGSEIKTKENMTGIKINIKRRNEMMSNITNTAVLRQRGGAGDEDSIASTKTGVEVEGIYRKDSDTQETNNNNNNNNDISGNDNISDDINDNEEEESVEDDVENEDGNNNNNNEGTNTSDEISDIEEDKYNDDKDDDGNTIPRLQEREVENSSDEKYSEEGVDDDAHCINNVIRSKNANTAGPRPRGGTEDAYRIEGTRSSVEDEEVDLCFQGSDDDKSTNDIFARTSEEHDHTNEEAAPSTSFEESHTATLKRRQQSRNFVLDELDEDESSPMGGSMENDKMEGNIRISTWNPNGINANQIQSILQQSLDLSIDIQGYSEVNRDFLKQNQRRALLSC
jgi:hypothetical protein